MASKQPRHRRPKPSKDRPPGYVPYGWGLPRLLEMLPPESDADDGEGPGEVKGPMETDVAIMTIVPDPTARRRADDSSA